MALVVLLVLGAALFLTQQEAGAQIPSTLDTLRVVNVTTGPGDTFFVDIYMRNVDTLGAYAARFVYNSALIEPLTDTVDATVSVEQVTFLRGGSLWDIGAAGLQSAGVLTLLATDFDLFPNNRFNPGAGVDARMKWRVLPSATPQTTTVTFENDPLYPATYNVLGPASGLTFKRPVLTNGTVTITTSQPGTPSITNCPSAPVNASQSQLVQFSISATDPNGDNLSLQASNLPSGATFTPSNPISGNTTVTGTFQWIPSTLQSGAFNVSFRATDSPDGNQSPFCNVTINVGTGPVGNAPDVICQVSSITVDQGQNVQLNVSASDADGDSITLTALNLPTGATFSPSTTIVGPTPVQGTLNWTPSFAQSGAFTLTFQATDSDGLTDVCNTTVFVEEIDIDQLFTTSAVGQVPQGGVAGTPDVVIPVNFLNVQNSYGVQFDFVYDPTIFTPTQVQTTDRLAGFQVYEDLGDNPGRLRVLAFSLSGDPIAAGTTSLLFNIVGNVVAPNAPGLYPITFENAWESISPDPEAPSVQLATSDGVIAIDNLGDANLDTRIDIGDVVAVVGYILSNYQFNLRQFVAGDVTVDALLDVFDLVGIINLIYGLPIGPSPDQPEINNPPAYVKFEYDVNDGPYGSYRLSTETEVDIAGAQIAVAYDPRVGAIGAPQLEDDASGLSLQYRDDGSGHLTALLLYNPNEAGSVIRTGQSKVLRIPLTGSPASVAPVTLRSIKLAATDASEIEVESASAVPRSFTLMQNYPNPFNPSTRIAFTISGAQSAATVSRVRLDIFNVLGQRVTTLVDSHLEPGQYEFEWDGRDRSGNTMASGLYFYRLQADGRAETKKMVLLK
ncbi:MAG: putative Ig domain-containing protein [Candidatus Zixiibacteriota bacterium]